MIRMLGLVLGFTSNVKPFYLDVTDESSVEAAVAATVKEFRAIDVLVNNAGYGLFGPAEGASVEQLEALFRTNVLGVACVTKHVVPMRRERKPGTIVLERSLVRTSHPAYTAAFDNFMGWVRKEDAKAPGPERVAEVIYRAATDRSARLRDPVGGKVILALTALFPDALWRSLNAAGMTRPAK